MSTARGNNKKVLLPLVCKARRRCIHANIDDNTTKFPLNNAFSPKLQRTLNVYKRIYVLFKSKNCFDTPIKNEKCQIQTIADRDSIIREGFIIIKKPSLMIL
jgi:hypothetical protein